MKDKQLPLQTLGISPLTGFGSIPKVELKKQLD